MGIVRILVVEDSPVMAKFLSFALAAIKGAKVERAEDGMTAVRMISENAYSIVLLDLNLPLLDGMKLLAMVRDRPETKELPVVIISSESADATLERARELGVSRFLKKPVQASQVRDVVNEVLDLPTTHVPSQVQERRVTPRLEIAISVHCDHPEEGELTTSDISPFGAFVVSNECPVVGTKVNLVLRLPHVEAPVRVGGTVVHSRSGEGGGFGVRFDPESDELRQELIEAFWSP